MIPSQVYHFLDATKTQDGTENLVYANLKQSSPLAISQFTDYTEMLNEANSIGSVINSPFTASNNNTFKIMGFTIYRLGRTSSTSRILMVCNHNVVSYNGGALPQFNLLLEDGTMLVEKLGSNPIYVCMNGLHFGSAMNSYAIFDFGDIEINYNLLAGNQTIWLQPLDEIAVVGSTDIVGSGIIT